MVSAYICPSDESPVIDDSSQCAKYNYSASAGPIAQSDTPNCSCASYSTWNQYALAPYVPWGTGAGPFYTNSTSVPLSAITDGLSNTIFFGEALPACCATQTQGWTASNTTHGRATTIIPLNYNSCETASSDGCHLPCNWSSGFGFRSRHPGGVQFSFGDGSVHFLSETIDYQNYQYLGGKSDGHLVQLPE